MSSSEANLEKYRIPLNEILRVTRNFSEDTLIGDGGFGMVYTGQLSEEWQNRTVAIKRLNRDGYQGNNEFRNELEMVSSFHHPNIISFIGYCDEANEMIIVYEFAKNGSLDRHLQNPDKMCVITWEQRLKICLGAAKGLKYLHSGLGEHNRVIHRDMKSANILLDENLEAKICDFGLSRFGARNEEHTQLLTKIAGTRNYMDPLYAERSRLTKESDLYSFGVVMFEMSSGTLVYHQKCFGDDAKPQFLLDVVRSCYDDDKYAAQPEKLIDPTLRDHIDMQSFHTFNKIAHECINLKLEQRPTMAKIIRKIEQALNIQLNYESPLTSITMRRLDSFVIPLEEINLATQNFKPETIIAGKYKYGAVHRGQIYRRWQNRTMTITRLNPESYQGENEFINKLRIISSIHHQNISPFIGYCYEANERIMVHQHAIKGSLADYFEIGWNASLKLKWQERLKICLGAARGLQYLHSALGEEHEEMFENITCDNILLDENMEAKISFFGLSPQVRKYNSLYEHISDICSFGVILFEILSGQQSYCLERRGDTQTQINQLHQYHRNNELDRYVDDCIKDLIGSRCLNILIETAYRCITWSDTRRTILERRRAGSGPTTFGRDLRPRFTMDDVVDMIEHAMDFEGNGN